MRWARPAITLQRMRSKAWCLCIWRFLFVPSGIQQAHLESVIAASDIEACLSAEAATSDATGMITFHISLPRAVAWPAARVWHQILSSIGTPATCYPRWDGPVSTCSWLLHFRQAHSSPAIVAAVMHCRHRQWHWYTTGLARTRRRTKNGTPLTLPPSSLQCTGTATRGACQLWPQVSTRCTGPFHSAQCCVRASLNKAEEEVCQWHRTASALVHSFIPVSGVLPSNLHQFGTGGGVCPGAHCADVLRCTYFR